MKNKDIVYRKKHGFSVDLKDKWFYEGDLVNITADRPDGGSLALTGAAIKSVCMDTDEIILEKDQTSYRVSLYNVKEISIA